MEKKSAGSVKGRVCVTGANGYVASWLVKMLLNSGYNVTGTVRDLGDNKKIGHLMELEGAKERLKLVKADLMVEGSFDDAVMGCDGVFHTASPIPSGPLSDPRAELVDPAVKGTLNVLRSCKKNPMLKKVVLTSSSTTLARPAVYPKEPVVLDETSWSSTELCENLKLWYPLAKTLAEQEAWDFAKQNSINLIAVVPSWIVGPSLPLNLHGTALCTLNLLRGDIDGEFSRRGRRGYVHIDDVSHCHVLVYEDEAAQGRYICSSRVLDVPELAGILAKRYPWLPIIPSSFHNYEKRPHFEYDTSKVKNLGIKFKGIEETFDDFIQYLKEHGRLP